MLARSFFPLCLLLTAAAGCQPSATVDPAVVAEARERLLLAEEPADAETPDGLRAQEGGFTSGQVTLVGQVGGIPNPWKGVEDAFPWRAGEASFFLVDPTAAAAFADHAKDDPDHADNCPFCASHAADNAQSVAVVTFSDAAGKTIPVGAKELLSLKEGAMVVVRGDAQMKGDLLIVEADGVYVR